MKYLISLVLGLAAVSLTEANSCETMLCPAGQVCEMQTVQCFRAPCDPVPVCVENPCNLIDCPQGQRCELQQVQCFTTPCNPQPTCVPDEHPGTCPEPSGLAGICVFDPNVNCLSDAACKPAEKCCSEGCGKVCKKALYTLPVPVGPTVDPECAAILCLVGTECRRETVPCLRPPCPTRVGCFPPRTNVVENPCLTMRCSRGYECRVQTCRPGTPDRCPLNSVCKRVSNAMNPCEIGKPVLSTTDREIFCGLGGGMCPRGSSCKTHPADAYAVCCLNSNSVPPPPPPPPGSDPNVLANPCIAAFCARGSECRVKACEPGALDSCSITASCQPRSTAPSPCPSGKPVLSATSNREMFCGRGPSREQCPRGTFCNIHPADRYAVCCLDPTPAPAPSPKPGTCPRPSGFGICVEQCSGDSSCPGTQKCCSNGCGHVCMQPESSQVSRRRSCQRATQYCYPRGSYRPRRCEEDEDCPGAGKCCRTRRCGKVCVPGRPRSDRSRRRRRG